MLDVLVSRCYRGLDAVPWCSGYGYWCSAGKINNASASASAVVVVVVVAAAVVAAVAQ